MTALPSLAALLATALVLIAFAKFTFVLVPLCLVSTLVANALLTVWFATQAYWTAVVLTCAVSAWSALYAASVWHRIPLASANLATAAEAVMTNNGGVLVMAYVVMGAFVLVYGGVWMLAVIGVYVKTNCGDYSCKDDGGINGLWIAFFVISYYWTAKVAQNILHVTVSGVVGTWWFAPEEASQFWSPAIGDSFSRAVTYSLGSICFGSLLTAVFQVSYHVARSAVRQGRGNSFLLCCMECILGFLERIVEYFNKYAMVYVGLYGYDFLTAGKKTATLFSERGWTFVLNDDLVGRVLIIVSIVVGLLTGAVGLMLAKLHPSWTDEFGTAQKAVSFFVPFFIGAAMSTIVVGVISSAVDTILVTFCEAPQDFERNHPGLHRQMTAAWRQVYPETVLHQ
jgi:hypothetical protein